MEHSPDYSALFPAALEGLFQRSLFSSSRSSPKTTSFSGNFFQKSSSTYLTLCLITPHSKFAPLRSNDRRTGSVAVHAMLGAKWSALANRWGQCPTTQHCPLFFVEAKECSLMNVGPNPPKCSTRSCRMFIVP